MANASGEPPMIDSSSGCDSITGGPRKAFDDDDEGGARPTAISTWPSSSASKSSSSLSSSLGESKDGSESLLAEYMYGCEV